MSSASSSSLNRVSAPPPSLSRGARGSAVTELQQRLQATGFSPGGIDGKFGPKTAKAVRSFQGAHGLPKTGSVDAATASALASAPTALQRSLQSDSFQAAAPTAKAAPAGVTTSPRAGETVNAKALSITTRLARRPDLQPRGGVTHCNQFASAYASQMLGNTAQVRRLFSGNAHQQYQHLAAAARTGSGVREVTAAQAGQLAASGKTVVVATSTLSKGGHGHIAAVIGTSANGSIRTGQAGSTNYADGRLSSRFTGRAASKAHYYVVG